MSRLHDVDIKVEFDKFNLAKVTRTNILTEERAFVLHNLFSPEECKRIINAAEEEGFDKLRGYDPSYRNNLRLMINSKTIIQELERRVKQFVEHELWITDETITIHKNILNHGLWRYHGLNPHLRLCKYDPSGHFSKHTDAGYHPDPKQIRTIKTCMVYLNAD